MTGNKLDSGQIEMIMIFEFKCNQIEANYIFILLQYVSVRYEWATQTTLLYLPITILQAYQI